MKFIMDILFAEEHVILKHFVHAESLWEDSMTLDWIVKVYTNCLLGTTEAFRMSFHIYYLC